MARHLQWGTVIMMLQRSPEWYAARLGKATASRIDAIMAPRCVFGSGIACLAH